MQKFVLIKDLATDTEYGMLVLSHSHVKALGFTERAKDWQDWVNLSGLDPETALLSLPPSLLVNDEKPHTELTLSELERTLSSDAFADAKDLLGAPTLSYHSGVPGFGRRYVVTSALQSKSYSGANASILTVPSHSRQLVIEYKGRSFRVDSQYSEVNMSLKAARALWDPNIGPGGGWRCPPGTQFGGYITDRFGRGCGVSIIRRVGRALVNAGRGVDQVGQGRDRSRLERAARRAERGGGVQERARRGVAGAARGVARALEGGAERLFPQEPTRGTGRRARRNIQETTPTPERIDEINQRLSDISTELSQLASATPTSEITQRLAELENESSRLRSERDGVGPQRFRTSRPSVSLERVIPETTARRPREGGRRPVRRPITEGRRAGAIQRAAERLRRRQQDNRRPNRYRNVDDASLSRLLFENEAKPLAPGSDPEIERQKLEERSEIYREMARRGIEVPENFRDEARELGFVREQRRAIRVPGQRRERVARALERGARRVLGEPEDRQRNEVDLLQQRINELDDELQPLRERLDSLSPKEIRKYRNLNYELARRRSQLDKRLGRDDGRRVQDRATEQARRDRLDFEAMKESRQRAPRRQRRQRELGGRKPRTADEIAPSPYDKLKPLVDGGRLEPADAEAQVADLRRRFEDYRDGKRQGVEGFPDYVADGLLRNYAEAIDDPSVRNIPDVAWWRQWLDSEDSSQRALAERLELIVGSFYDKDGNINPVGQAVKDAIQPRISEQEIQNTIDVLGMALLPAQRPWDNMERNRAAVLSAMLNQFYDSDTGALNKRGREYNRIVQERVGDAPLADFRAVSVDNVEPERSLPDSRSLRNVHNRFPRGGLPIRAYWRDEPSSPTVAEMDRRFGDYYDSDNFLNSRGRLVNNMLNEQRRQPSQNEISNAQTLESLRDRARTTITAPSQRVPRRSRPSSEVEDRYWGDLTPGQRLDIRDAVETNYQRSRERWARRMNIDPEEVTSVGVREWVDAQDLPRSRYAVAVGELQDLLAYESLVMNESPWALEELSQGARRAILKEAGVPGTWKGMVRPAEPVAAIDVEPGWRGDTKVFREWEFYERAKVWADAQASTLGEEWVVYRIEGQGQKFIAAPRKDFEALLDRNDDDSRAQEIFKDVEIIYPRGRRPDAESLLLEQEQELNSDEMARLRQGLDKRMIIRTNNDDINVFRAPRKDQYDISGKRLLRTLTDAELEEGIKQLTDAQGLYNDLMLLAGNPDYQDPRLDEETALRALFGFTGAGVLDDDEIYRLKRYYQDELENRQYAKAIVNPVFDRFGTFDTAEEARDAANQLYEQEGVPAKVYEELDSGKYFLLPVVDNLETFMGYADLPFGYDVDRMFEMLDGHFFEAVGNTVGNRKVDRQIDKLGRALNPAISLDSIRAINDGDSWPRRSRDTTDVGYEAIRGLFQRATPRNGHPYQEQARDELVNALLQNPYNQTQRDLLDRVLGMDQATKETFFQEFGRLYSQVRELIDLKQQVDSNLIPEWEFRRKASGLSADGWLHLNSPFDERKLLGHFLLRSLERLDADDFEYSRQHGAKKIDELFNDSQLINRLDNAPEIVREPFIVEQIIAGISTPQDIDKALRERRNLAASYMRKAAFSGAWPETQELNYSLALNALDDYNDIAAHFKRPLISRDNRDFFKNEGSLRDITPAESRSLARALSASESIQPHTSARSFAIEEQEALGLRAIPENIRRFVLGDDGKLLPEVRNQLNDAHGLAMTMDPGDALAGDNVRDQLEFLRLAIESPNTNDRKRYFRAYLRERHFFKGAIENNRREGFPLSDFNWNPQTSDEVLEFIESRFGSPVPEVSSVFRSINNDLEEAFDGLSMQQLVDEQAFIASAIVALTNLPPTELHRQHAAVMLERWVAVDNVIRGRLVGRDATSARQELQQALQTSRSTGRLIRSTSALRNHPSYLAADNTYTPQTDESRVQAYLKQFETMASPVGHYRRLRRNMEFNYALYSGQALNENLPDNQRARALRRADRQKQAMKLLDRAFSQAMASSGLEKFNNPALVNEVDKVKQDQSRIFGAARFNAGIKLIQALVKSDEPNAPTKPEELIQRASKARLERIINYVDSQLAYYSKKLGDYSDRMRNQDAKLNPDELADLAGNFEQLSKYRDDVISRIYALDGGVFARVEPTTNLDAEFLADDIRPQMPPRRLAQSDLAPVWRAVDHLKNGGAIEDIPDETIVQAMIADAQYVEPSGEWASISNLSSSDLYSEDGLTFRFGNPVGGKLDVSDFFFNGMKGEVGTTAENERFKFVLIKPAPADMLWQVLQVEDKQTGKMYFLKTAAYGHDDALMELVGAAAGEVLEIGLRRDHIRVGPVVERRAEEGGYSYDPDGVLEGRWILMPHIAQIDNGPDVPQRGRSLAIAQRPSATTLPGWKEIRHLRQARGEDIEWRDVARILAMDIALINQDRNSGNMMFYVTPDGKVRIAPIDHGLIGGARARQDGMGADELLGELAEERGPFNLAVPLAGFGMAVNDIAGIFRDRNLKFPSQQARELFEKQLRMSFERMLGRLDYIFSIDEMQLNGVKLTDSEKRHLVALRDYADRRIRGMLASQAQIDALVDIFA